MDLPLAIKGFLDRRRDAVAAAVAGLALLALFFSLLGGHRAAGRTLAAKKDELARFGPLAAEYLEKKAAVDMLARKARAVPGAGSAITEIELIGARAGAKELIASIKPLDEKRSGGYIEKGMEVRLEKIDLNRLVNLIYLLENNRRLFMIREFSMKSRFENPDLLDVTIGIASLTMPGKE